MSVEWHKSFSQDKNISMCATRTENDHFSEHAEHLINALKETKNKKVSLRLNVLHLQDLEPYESNTDDKV